MFEVDVQAFGRVDLSFEGLLNFVNEVQSNDQPVEQS